MSYSYYVNIYNYIYKYTYIVENHKYYFIRLAKNILVFISQILKV